MNQNRLAFLFQTIAICVLLTISFCSVYSSDFYRIENTKLRILGVRHFPNPDVAPGDTVTARIYFAGSPVVNVDNFTISFKSIYGVNGISY